MTEPSTQKKHIKALASTLRVDASDLEFLQALDEDTIVHLRKEMTSALASRHHAFKQSLQHSTELLPRLLRAPVRRVFRSNMK